MQKPIGLMHLQGAIQHRLSVFGVPKPWIKPFADLVYTWVKCSGVEWTVKRLKGLKVDLYRSKSGLPLQSTWIAKNRKGNFSGVIGSLFAWASRGDAEFQSVVHTLMVYSLFKHQTMSDAQREKFVTAVGAATNAIASVFYEELASFVKSQHMCSQSMGIPPSIMEFRGSESKRAPVLGRSSVPQEFCGLESVRYFTDSPYHYGLYERYQSLYAHVLRGVNIPNWKQLLGEAGRMAASCPWDHEGIWGGEVHFLQEPGLKLRAIASPYMVHQLALKPLGDKLYSLLRVIPWDCTHDHTKPVCSIQAHLSSNRTIHSVDLSNATDYFPLEVQLTVLRALLGSHPSIDLFSEISRSQWKSSIGTVRWNQGQPLGLYPSFASFGLAHGLLLDFLRRDLEGVHTFFVLGDDVVILSDELYTKYIRYLGYLGCPFSADKSISSNKLCEFAGKVITSSKVVPSYKWRELSNDNFLDICRNYGRKAVSLLSPSQKAVVEKVQHCVEPFGLNWSYPGSNLEKMVELTDLLYKPNERVLQSQTGLFRTVASNYYHSSSDYLRSLVSSEELAERVCTFDEKVTAILTSMLPVSWKAILRNFVLRGGFAGVPAVFGREAELPPEHTAPSRVTTLDRYRNILNL